MRTAMTFDRQTLSDGNYGMRMHHQADQVVAHFEGQNGLLSSAREPKRSERQLQPSTLWSNHLNGTE